MKWAALDSRQRSQFLIAAGSYILGISLLLYGLFFLGSDQVSSRLFAVAFGLLFLMLWQDVCHQFALDKLEKKILKLMEGGA